MKLVELVTFTFLAQKGDWSSNLELINEIWNQMGMSKLFKV